MSAQLVILSGKGGTGKTAVTGALAHLASQDPALEAVVLVDADVDAANLEILLRPTHLEEAEFFGQEVAEIRVDRCIGCGLCQDICRFGALLYDNDTLSFQVDPLACEGCAACLYQCPEDSIRMVPRLAGHWFCSRSVFGPLFHARLRAAQENSGKLVTLIKEKGKEAAHEQAFPLMMVDGPPGIGCPAIAAASEADLALLVAEPTCAGVYDLDRVLQLVDSFRLPSLVVINKADLHPDGAEAVERLCRGRGVRVAGHIPYDDAVPRTMVRRSPVTEGEPDAPASVALRDLWLQIKNTLEQMAPMPSGEVIQLTERRT